MYEQQLVMVLGLLRFTKASQSLVLLDEPDTHLNPHWQLSYIRLLLETLVGDNSKDNSASTPLEELESHLTSQVLLSTHDPLAIASLRRNNLHLFRRRPTTETCEAVTPDEDPRGMGFTGILTSEMFGLKSDLDEETMALLRKHAELAVKHRLSTKEKYALRDISSAIEGLGFKSASSDPYYRSYLQALLRRTTARELFDKQTWTREDLDSLARETDAIIKKLDTENAV